MAIFSASAVSIAIMGVVLEIGKLVTASWLYQNWTTVPKVLKYYLTSAVVVLMFITSMGIFGYLSKSHIDAGSNTSQIQIKIDRLDNYIKSEQKTIYIQLIGPDGEVLQSSSTPENSTISIKDATVSFTTLKSFNY